MSKRKRPEHPPQPLVWSGKVVRYKENKIVRWMLDKGTESGLFSLNTIAVTPFPKEDRRQLTQLIGYSVSGAGEMVGRKRAAQAHTEAARMYDRRFGKRKPPRKQPRR